MVIFPCVFCRFTGPGNLPTFPCWLLALPVISGSFYIIQKRENHHANLMGFYPLWLDWAMFKFANCRRDYQAGYTQWFFHLWDVIPTRLSLHHLSRCWNCTTNQPLSHHNYFTPRNVALPSPPQTRLHRHQGSKWARPDSETPSTSCHEGHGGPFVKLHGAGFGAETWLPRRLLRSQSPYSLNCLYQAIIILIKEKHR